MAVKKGAPGYNNLVPETSAYFKDKPKPKKPERERQFAYDLKVHIKDKADCEAFAKCIQHPLSRSEKAFTYSTRVSYPASQWKFVEDKPPKPKKVSKKKKDQQRYKNWFYNRHWVDMPSFRNEKIPPYISFNVRFNTKKAFMDFALKTGQTISVETKSIWYPERQSDDLASTFWISSLKNKNPRYPVYIVSKGRAGTRLTSRTLEKMKVPYFIAVEPQEYDQYAVFIDPKKILPLPFSNHGDGPGPARNWCMANAKERGFQRCWLLDDNIDSFYRLHENKRIRVGDGAIFRAAEDFVDRYENVPVAGFQYRFFIAPNQDYPPFVKNTRIYSCLLVDNHCKHEWRGRYNEDTILSLDVLSDGDCTIQFNSFLQGKAATQTLKGGNTDEFYSPEGQEEHAEGTRAKSEMLQAIYPDLVEVVYRYGRWHHDCDYSPFQRNRLKPKIDLTKLPKINEYGMKLQGATTGKADPSKPEEKLIRKRVRGYDIDAYVRIGKTDEFIVSEVGSYSKLKLNEDDVVLDIGSQIGMFTVLALKRGAKKVISYEPEKDNFDLSKRNLPLNGFSPSQYELNNRAVVGNSDKTRTLYLNGKKNTGGHSLIKRRGRAGIEVKCANINDILREHRPTVVKIDTEGAEYEILKGVRSFKGVRELIFEFHHADLRDISTHRKYKEILGLMKKHFAHVEARKDTGGAWVNLVYCATQRRR